MQRLYAGEPEAMQERLDELNETLRGEGEVVSLFSPDREAAWARMAGGV